MTGNWMRVSGSDFSAFICLCSDCSSAKGMEFTSGKVNCEKVYCKKLHCIWVCQRGHDRTSTENNVCVLNVVRAGSCLQL